MEKLSSGKKGKVAGAYMILYLLLIIVNDMKIMPHYIDFGEARLIWRVSIQYALDAAAVIMIVVCAMRNKNKLLLFIAAIVSAVAIFAGLVFDIIYYDEISVTAAFVFNVLYRLSFIAVAAFGTFSLSSLVKYTWYVPAVLITAAGIAAYIPYFSRSPEYIAEMLTTIASNLTQYAAGTAAFLYLGLWLKAKAEEEAPAIGYGF